MVSQKKNSFLLKLFHAISNESYYDIIRWEEDGKSFEIVDDLKFCKEILPSIFKHNNFSSFIRQLNMYNFHKTSGNRNIFSHPMFVKDKPENLLMIKRKKPNLSNKKNRLNDFIEKIKKIKNENQLLQIKLDILECMFNLTKIINSQLFTYLIQQQNNELAIKEKLMQHADKLKVHLLKD